MLEQFSATIEKLYAAAAEPKLWGEALRAVEDYTGSTGAVLNMVPMTSDAPPICLAGSFSDSDCAEYAVNYMWRCPRIAYGQAHPDSRIHYDSMVLNESEMDRDPTYEWYGKHGLRYYVAGWIGTTQSHRAYMSLQRSRRQGHVEPHHVEQFALVLKHMGQALALAVKLGTLDRQRRFDLSLMDMLSCGIFALDAEGRVLLTNAKAERLLRDGDGLLVQGGRLQCRLSTQQMKLARLLRSAKGLEHREPFGGWTLIERSPGRKPLSAFVAPAAEGAIFGLFQPAVLVIVSDPSDIPAADEQALHELFGLSPAEARLARSLSSGHSVESAAALLGVQQATIRSELKSIFRKLGVSRQQDLVRVLTSLAMMPAAAP